MGALVTTKGSVKRWIPTKKRKFSTRSKTGSLGWTRIQRQTLKKSKRNTRRSRESVHPLFLSTMALAAAVAVAVEPRRMRRKHTMSCRMPDYLSRVGTLGRTYMRGLLSPDRTFLLWLVQFVWSSLSG